MVFQEIESTMKKLYRYCLKLTRCPWMSEDLVQESMLTLCRIIREEPEREITMAFLYRVAKNTYVDSLRKNRSRLFLDDRDEAVSTDFNEWNELLEVLYSVLPLKQAMLVALKDVFGFSSQEMADMLRLSNAAVKTALHRARIELRSANHTGPALNLSEADFKLVSEIENAFKTANASKLFALYRVLEARQFSIQGNAKTSVLFVIDPDGNTLEIRG
ncbi:RNA polymerase sigma factor [Jeotgalibacillus sp. ET6]|uniref:RNA polymerase sigma factor n=1 Tax=Jeotgalibacillus sp. ET6 TaxID=3037260 RepID=UPI00241827FC|nr:RNA polymerase sigma factor [Jeotgalibacillus sp. ET6]MDG5472001.1 RNA polymerase sigma factor [Jeotgalibacillus sp. ET6]